MSSLSDRLPQLAMQPHQQKRFCLVSAVQETSTNVLIIGALCLPKQVPG